MTSFTEFLAWLTVVSLVIYLVVLRHRMDDLETKEQKLANQLTYITKLVEKIAQTTRTP